MANHFPLKSLSANNTPPANLADLRKDVRSRLKKTALCAALLAALFCGCAKDTAVKNAGSANDGAIICFGDSITAGKGAPEGGDYPALLAQLSGREVINAGVSGNTSDDGMLRIESDVVDRRPSIVILQFGGNDFLHQMPFEATMNNIEQMILRIQGAGAVAVLADTSESAFMARYNSGFARIAQRRRALFIPDLLKDISTNPELMSDEVHPNGEGYKILAQRVYTAIKPYLPPKAEQ
jgi:lysophospholipase L1-like esterase